MLLIAENSRHAVQEGKRLAACADLIHDPRLISNESSHSEGKDRTEHAKAVWTIEAVHQGRGDLEPCFQVTELRGIPEIHHRQDFVPFV
jgi:hypothetical protein